VLAPEKARQRARDILAGAQFGEDPMEERRVAKVHTLRSFIDEEYEPWARANIRTGAATVARLKAGFAERDITPELGMEQPGGYGKAFHRSFHDACKVRAAVFDDGATRVALVGIDALMVPRRLVQDVRDAVHKRCGIAPGPTAITLPPSISTVTGPTGVSITS
jgi:predicted neutral ceramidase superfamily lipid hydrolase